MTTYQSNKPNPFEKLIRVLAIASIIGVLAVMLGGLFHWFGL